jgi:hypothetical protein
MAARLQHEIKELQQKAKAAKLRLESEMKVRINLCIFVAKWYAQ